VRYDSKIRRSAPPNKASLFDGTTLSLIFIVAAITVVLARQSFVATAAIGLAISGLLAALLLLSQKRRR
jgi:hypothetical protein